MEESSISSPSPSPPPPPPTPPPPISVPVEDKLSRLSVTDKITAAEETIESGDATETVDRYNDVIEENVMEERENHNYDHSVNNSVRGMTRVGNYEAVRFPAKPGAETCAFYMKTGRCKFGLLCKFDHPPLNEFHVRGNPKDESFDTALESVTDKDDYAEKEGRVYCKYVHTPEGCKYGKRCKFNHSKKNSPASEPVLELNFMGLPIRQREQECSYYIRNGSCKFGARCRFNHPNPMPAEELDTLPVYNNNRPLPSPNASLFVSKSWSQSVTLNENPPYTPMSLSPTQPQWTAYQTPTYRPGNTQMAPTHVISVYSHQQKQISDEEFPQRPGQPECQYFLKTGNCNYKSACKFHHPKNGSEKSSGYSLSELGLPLRPGENMCTYYTRFGICKYGPSCKYNHPIDHAPYAPSVVGMSN